MGRKGVIYFFVLCLILGFSDKAEAQDIQFSQYYAAPLYLNPALAGINQYGRAGINYRTQWPQVASNLETYSFYIDYNFEDYNSSGGLILNRDREGRYGLQSTHIGLIYAYQMDINPFWTFNVCEPSYNPSRTTSRHHWYEINTTLVKPCALPI